MSTNKEIWESYTGYTKDLTEYSRKLGFAGVAIFWILKYPDGSFSFLTKIALVCFILFFLFDVLQSYVASRKRLNWNEKAEQEMSDETGSIQGEYKQPRSLDKPAQLYFSLKVYSIIFAYAFIVIEMFRRFAQ